MRGLAQIIEEEGLQERVLLMKKAKHFNTGELRQYLLLLKQVCASYLRKLFFNLKTCALWLFMALVTGLVVGAFSSAFAFCLLEVMELREAHPSLLFLLPFGGVVIVFLYHICGVWQDKGTNLVFTAVHGHDEDVPAYMAPLIFIASIITHLFGGSAGREGAALQMGGSLGNTIGRIFHFEEGDRKVLVMSGMSAAFSAVFGTPLAAAIFPMEMISVGIMHYAALVPCVFSAIMANRFAVNMGINPEAFVIADIPEFTAIHAAKFVLLGIFCAGLSVLFCLFLRGAGKFYHTFFKNDYVRVVAGGVLVIVLTLLSGTRDYNGAGTQMIARAIVGDVPWYAFFLKMLLTALTLAAGYKGGEIVPAFFTGATFGCLFGQLFGISPSMCAAAGMLAVFCGVTNCPIASMLIGFELFGFSGVTYLLIAVSISYMLSGYRGLYKEQIIVYSKYHPKYINIHSGDEAFDGADYEE